MQQTHGPVDVKGRMYENDIFMVIAHCLASSLVCDLQPGVRFRDSHDLLTAAQTDVGAMALSKQDHLLTAKIRHNSMLFGFRFIFRKWPGCCLKIIPRMFYLIGSVPVNPVAIRCVRHCEEIF